MKNLFFLFLLLFFYTSCQIEDRHVQNVKENSLIYTAENGVKLEIPNTRPISNVVIGWFEGTYENALDNDLDTYWYIASQDENFPSHKAYDCEFTVTLPTPVFFTKFRLVLRQGTVGQLAKITVSAVINGEIQIIGVDTPQYEGENGGYTTDISNDIQDTVDTFYIKVSYDKISYPMTIRNWIKFYTFTLYGVDSSQIYIIGNEGKTQQLARYNDEYTPFVYIDENKQINNLLLINPSKKSSSSKRICCKNPDGTYPSERIKNYCERMGVTDGILAFACFSTT